MKKKLVYLKMGNHNPQMQLALESIFDCTHIDWTTYKGDYEYLQVHLKNACHNFGAEYLFMHTQGGGIIYNETLSELSKGVKIINWTGDVRHPLPEHYIETGKNIFLSLFTNDNDVETMRSHGLAADFLQVGFDDRYFNPVGTVNGHYQPILFLGSNYSHNANFPLTKYRIEMVEALRSEFTSFFGLYGTGWGNANGYLHDYHEEGTAYRSCKIAISLSHFEYSRYSSDRLYRIMGSGAFCLSHQYPNIEKDFKLGEELVVWESIEDLIQKIKYYLNNDAERRKIALKGCELVRSRFTWYNFAENLLSVIKKYEEKCNQGATSTMN